MKKAKMLALLALPAIAISGSVSAQTATAVATTDNVLPQLSLAKQQQHTVKMRAKSRAVVQDTHLLADSKAHIRKVIGNDKLQLSDATTKAYVLANFEPLWNSKQAEKAFIKDYAVFAASGVSSKAPTALRQILNSTSGSMKRDILLTDTFMDYMYYNQNVAKKADSWLYNNLGSYKPATMTDADIQSWVESMKNGSASNTVSKVIPSKNNIYTETVNKVLTGSGDSVPVSQLALNAQRLRYIRDFDNGLYVNIPSYKLQYYKKGNLALESIVAVGKTDRQTPVLTSRLSNVVVNPPWTAPPTIIKKDLLPKLAKNRNYGKSTGIQILTYGGKVVDRSTINFKQYVGDNAKKFPYMIRQKPGPHAALGRYKFNFPNSHAVYLHDTPHKEAFNREVRTASSGCVRVKKAAELASMLLKDAGWSSSRQKKVYDSEKTTSATAKVRTPVYLYYVTAWVENGQVHTLPDAYKLDKNVAHSNVNWQAVNSAVM